MREENNCSNCHYSKASKHDENYEVIELYCRKHDKLKTMMESIMRETVLMKNGNLMIYGGCMKELKKY